MLLRDDAAEAERAGQAVHVDRITGAGDRARSERQLVGLVQHRGEAIDVAAQRRAVRQQEVRRRAPAAPGAGACTTASSRRPRDRPAPRSARSCARRPPGAPGCAASGTAGDRRRPVRCAIGPVCSRRPASPTRATSSRSTKACTSSSPCSARDEAGIVLSLPRESARGRHRSPRRRRPTARRRARAPPPTRGCPRTSSSNSRRSKRNDDPNVKSSASGSPANRPDQRCAISYVTFVRSRRSSQRPSAIGGRRRGSLP